MLEEIVGGFSCWKNWSNYEVCRVEVFICFCLTDLRAWHFWSLLQRKPQQHVAKCERQTWTFQQDSIKSLFWNTFRVHIRPKILWFVICAFMFHTQVIIFRCCFLCGFCNAQSYCKALYILFNSSATVSLGMFIIKYIPMLNFMFQGQTEYLYQQTYCI